MRYLETLFWRQGVIQERAAREPFDRDAARELGAGQAVPAGVLIDALWDTAPPARPEDQLAVLMSRLRTVLGRDRIEHRDQGYLLHCDWLDAAELAMLTDEVERRRGRRAT